LACAVPPAHQRPARWRKHEVITGNAVKLTALGTDSKLRGRKHNQHRPSLIVVDDAENDESVRSPEQRQALSDWFDKALLKCGTPKTNVAVLGTIFHYDSLLARLTNPAKSPGWRALVYRAVESFATRLDLWDTWESIFTHREEFQGATGPGAAQSFYTSNQEAMLEGTRVLWPEKESYLELMILRLTEGRASFDSEKQNQPGATGDGCFQESDFVYWDQEFGTEEALLAHMGPKVRFFGGVDPSLGKAGNNRDDCGIVTIARHPATGVLYVLDADIRKRRPDQIIETVISYHRQRGYRQVAFEANQFQEFLADELVKRSKAAGCRVPVMDIKHSTDKLGRMQGLQPLVSSGQVRFTRRHVTLLEQLRQFPHGAHDDGPDALEMAVAEARCYREHVGYHGGVVFTKRG
jgi:predicted phage terminase large subunit-like protein